MAEEKVKKTTKGELGKISLGTVSSSAAALPIGKLKEFRKYYPEINFEIFESNTYGILEKLFNGEIDLGLVRTPFNQRELETKISILISIFKISFSKFVTTKKLLRTFFVKIFNYM